jgi:hypothetical protein
VAATPNNSPIARVHTCGICAPAVRVSLRMFGAEWLVSGNQVACGTCLFAYITRRNRFRIRRLPRRGRSLRWRLSAEICWRAKQPAESRRGTLLFRHSRRLVNLLCRQRSVGWYFCQWARSPISCARSARPLPNSSDLISLRISLYCANPASALCHRAAFSVR